MFELSSAVTNWRFDELTLRLQEANGPGAARTSHVFTREESIDPQSDARSTLSLSTQVLMSTQVFTPCKSLLRLTQSRARILLNSP